MPGVYQLVATNLSEESGIKFGGGAFLSGKWPQNPKGEDLTLLFTIKNDQINKLLGANKFPEGKFLSVFSTYNEKRYFLDDIVFTGDDLEFKALKSGFTRVLLSENSNLQENDNCLPSQNIRLEKRNLKKEDYPVFSFLSDEIPNGLFGYESLMKDYYFACQIYSADIPFKNGGLLGLSDANGYLFLKKEIEDAHDIGFFFVQTS